MKTISSLSMLVMAASLIFNTSCSAEGEMQNGADDGRIILNVSEETLSRISLAEENNTVVANWEKNDFLSVWPRPDAVGTSGYADVKDVYEFSLISGAGTKSAVFAGNIGSTPEYINAIYRKNIIKDVIRERGTDLAFQCDATEQLLTSDINKAPLLLAGVFRRNPDDGTYSPVGGKLIHGGVLFRICIEGLPAGKVIKKMTLDGTNIGLRPSFNINSVGNFTQISAGGGAGSIILSSSDDSVKTDSNGDVVMYAYIVPKNTVNLVTDRNVTITYADDTEFNVGVLKFAGKTVELGKCYTVTFDLISANTVIENFENAGEITF